MDAITQRLMVTPDFCPDILKLVDDWCKDKKSLLSSSTMSTLWINSSGTKPDETLKVILIPI